jgi:invasion protein IalB
MWTKIGVSLAVLLTLTSAAIAQRKHPPPEKFSSRPVQTEPQLDTRTFPPTIIIQSPWVKFCGKDNNPTAKEVCLTVKEARLKTGQFLAGAALIEQSGNAKKLFRVTLPLDIQSMTGMRMVIDYEAPRSSSAAGCVPNGCMVDFEATPELIASLKYGRELRIEGVTLPGRTLPGPVWIGPVAGYLLPLVDFARANDGPPTDPVQFEKDQRRRNAPPPSQQK